MSTEAFGRQRFATGNGEFNAFSFLIEQALNNVSVATLVRVDAVHSAPMPAVTGTVDVTPLVQELDGAGNAMEHSTIFGVPYFRLQGGLNAVVVDPQVGDIGFCVFADRDLSNAKASAAPGPVGSRRRFSMSDGLYVGGWAPQKTPVRYIEITDSGVNINSVGDVSITSTGTISTSATAIVEEVDIYEVTVPEFTIIGNLHVTGLVHCTWEGELIGVKFGGSGADLSTTGGPGQVVKQVTPGGAFSVGVVESAEVITNVTLGDTFTANQPFTLIAGVAEYVTALDAAPQVDGITLAAGVAGATVPAAMNTRQFYQTPDDLPGIDGGNLFLGSIGTLSTAPVTTTGAWTVALGRRVTSKSFMFNPEPPVQRA